MSLPRSILWLVTLAAILALTACGPSQSESTSPSQSFSEVWRPKSSLSRSQALSAATALSAAISHSQVYSIAETHSMEPILWGNFYLVAEKVLITDIHVGDIILYRLTPTSQIIVHTCVGNAAGRLTMKGYNNFNDDNASNPDQFITADMVVGRYVGCVVFDPNKP